PHLRTTLFPYTTLFRSYNYAVRILLREGRDYAIGHVGYIPDISKVKEFRAWLIRPGAETRRYGKDEWLDVAGDMNDVYHEYRVKDRKGTRLNSSHVAIS